MLLRFQPGRRFRLPRTWSNGVLRKIAPLFDGDVINVSGWRDDDKEGGKYRTYFTQARSYAITNYGGFRGGVSEGEISLNLEADLPAELHRCADVIFNHTTLEHVFDVFKAVANLCTMSRDIVIVVVPAMQEEHTSESYGDYWRFMSGGLRQLFAANGFTPIYLVSSPHRHSAVYHLCVASRDPGRWAGRLPVPAEQVNDGRAFFRENLLERFVQRVKTSLSVRSSRSRIHDVD
jgi:hypothetical protein